MQTLSLVCQYCGYLSHFNCRLSDCHSFACAVVSWGSARRHLKVNHPKKCFYHVFTYTTSWNAKRNCYNMRRWWKESEMKRLREREDVNFVSAVIFRACSLELVSLWMPSMMSVSALFWRILWMNWSFLCERNRITHWSCGKHSTNLMLFWKFLFPNRLS